MEWRNSGRRTPGEVFFALSIFAFLLRIIVERGDFGVGLSVEGFSFNGSGGVGLATPVGTVSGGIKVHVENANCIESLYRGVHGLFDVTDPDQQRYFATIQPETEALPVLAGVFIAGVAAGASAYKAGK